MRPLISISRIEWGLKILDQMLKDIFKKRGLDLTWQVIDSLLKTFPLGRWKIGWGLRVRS